MLLGEVTTPAVVIDAGAFEHNLTTMSEALPGTRLRPHVKAHKCTAIARRQQDAGHRGFTCATVRECEGMAAAGLGVDLLLANEVLDARRLGRLVRQGHGIILAVDSEETVRAAKEGGVSDVVIDVNVGLLRCGCPPAEAGQLAQLARQSGLTVRGVMGYEGHVMGLEQEAARREGCETAMALLLEAHGDVGGELVSAGGTGTYQVNTWATEIQAGSYVLMDTHYGREGLPFRQAVFIMATVISSRGDHSVADCGLKALGMDHGNPAIAGAEVAFCSDEHVTFSPAVPVGTRVLVQPAHVDPTMAYHDKAHLVTGLAAGLAGGPIEDAEVAEIWEIDLRGW